MTRDYRQVSYWFDSFAAAGGNLTPRPPLTGDSTVDVAIVGAGFTGLWTAYYLRRLDPSMRIAVLEKDIAGFGASGRNGGWCSALFPSSDEKVARLSSREGALALRAAMRDTVDEVGVVAAREGVDCDFAKGGTISLARTPAQLNRAQAEHAHALQWGAHDTELLDAEQARQRLAADGTLGGLYTPHCAAIHPVKLVRGLADVVERDGVAIYEQTPVTSIAPHRVRTAAGVVAADVVVRATEAFTARLPGHRRVCAPIYSLMVATEPLDDAQWQAIGLRDRETFGDLRHLIIYGQRTADGRIAFGGRGAPYHFGSRIAAGYDRAPNVFAALRESLRELLPGLRDVRFTHEWGGPLAAPRDWFASVGLDRDTGIAWAGGYVGDGVATTNLAGRTLADLICGRDTELTRLPWAQHRSRRWEPEPLRWLGINASLAAMKSADRKEHRGGGASLLAAGLNRMIGR
jgi:glycine/D-amino acid oxidase-like deaminating enzyme